MRPARCPASAAAIALLILGACATPRAHEDPPPRGLGGRAEPSPAAPSAALADSGAPEARVAADAAAAAAQLDPDGNDALDETAASSAPSELPTGAAFVPVGKPPLGWQRICDLRAKGDRLFLAHANQPLGTDGATITTYRPEALGGSGKTPFAIAFDWNRFGEPTKGGGGGQGFLRVRAIDGRLYVPDADPPYGGLGALDHGTEGYVFVSDKDGVFARARAPHAQLPGRPDAEGRAGAAVLPRAYHVLDVVKFRGHVYASTGSVPPTARAWSGPSPGALHVATPDLARFTYALGFPSPYPGGVWRLTYLVRFRDRLYAGLQDYDGASPYDHVVFTLPPDRDVLRESDAAGVRVTTLGAAFTLRWYADGGALYWIAGTRDGDVALRRTRDGDTWERLELPKALGRPTDITRYRGHLVVLGERGLVALAADGSARVLATIQDKKTPFVIDDVFCTAPLAVLGDALYAGGQRGATLYRLESPAAAAP